MEQEERIGREEGGEEGGEGERKEGRVRLISSKQPVHQLTGSDVGVSVLDSVVWVVSSVSRRSMVGLNFLKAARK